jgi:hypothetical protein
MVSFTGTCRGAADRVAVKGKGIYLGPEDGADVKFAVKQTQAPR